MPHIRIRTTALRQRLPVLKPPALRRVPPPPRLRPWKWTRAHLSLTGLIALLVLVTAFPPHRDTPVEERIVVNPAAPVLTEAASPKQMPVFYVATKEKKLALTFDISWGEEVPARVLSALEELDEQKATFFLSGPWSRDHAGIVRAIAAAGHEIASHGQAHVNLSQYTTSQIAANIEEADAILERVSGRSPRYFRPPNGDYDAGVVETARSLGYETVIWSVDSLDWKNPGVDVIHDRVLKGVFPGAILLFHASDSAKQTAAAIPGLVARLRSQGWELVTLGELWKLGEPVREDPRGRPYKPNTAVVPAPPRV